MKLARKLKTLILSVATVFLLAAPAYSWTHDDGFGPARRGYYYQGYNNYDHGRPWYRHRAHRRVFVERPWYGHRSYGPAVQIGVPFGFSVPGFSFYVGP